MGRGQGNFERGRGRGGRGRGLNQSFSSQISANNEQEEFKGNFTPG